MCIISTSRGSRTENMSCIKIKLTAFTSHWRGGCVLLMMQRIKTAAHREHSLCALSWCTVQWPNLTTLPIATVMLLKLYLNHQKTHVRLKLTALEKEAWLLEWSASRGAPIVGSIWQIYLRKMGLNFFSNLYITAVWI